MALLSVCNQAGENVIPELPRGNPVFPSVYVGGPEPFKREYPIIGKLCALSSYRLFGRNGVGV